MENKIYDQRLLRVKSVEEKRVTAVDADDNYYFFDTTKVPLCVDDVFYFKDRIAHVLHKGEDYHYSIFVTNQCNSNCIMCPDAEVLRKKNSDISLTRLLKEVAVLPDSIETIDITGGEPTLFKNDLLVLIEYIFEKLPYINVMMLSNGRSFADRRYALEFMRFSNRRFRVEIPIHSSNEGLHDFIAGDNGSFKQTIRGIKNLHQAGVKIGIRIVVSRLNFQELDSIIAYVAEHFPFVPYINLMGLEVMGSAYKNKQKVWIEYDCVKEALQSAVVMCITHGIEPQLFNYPLCIFEKKYWHCYRKSITPHKVKYMPECDLCTMKEYCGGFFNSTIRNTEFCCKPFVRGKI